MNTGNHGYGQHISPEQLKKKIESLKPGESFQYEGVIYKRNAKTGKIVAEPVIEHDYNDDDIRPL